MGAKDKPEKGSCFCPYCDAELEETPICRVCKVTIFYCPRCRKPMPREKEICPNCGAAVKEAVA